MDINTLQKYKAKGLVRFQAHPVYPLLIWNYTEKCQYEKAWDDITSKCRGLITDTKGKIVARSFNKFHNLAENRFTPTEQYVMYEKLDGSLGILFFYDSQWLFASRGSFVSPQAEKAKLMLKRYSLTQLDVLKSYVFEIIYPENRVVVDYGDRAELVYLASFLADGEESFEAELMKASGFPVAKVFTDIDYRNFQALDWENSEGAVVRFSNGDRVKVKFTSYLELHRVITNLNPITVWEWFKTGKPLREYLELVPDELFDWMQDTWRNFENKFNKIYDDVHDFYSKTEHLKSKRGNFARAVKDHEYRTMLFALLDGQDNVLRDMICNKFRPKGITTSAKFSRRPLNCNDGRLIILCGISGAGKSNWACSYVEMHADAVIISRDAIRLMLFGNNDEQYYNSIRLGDRERTVSDVQSVLIKSSLEMGKTVIIDDTNLTSCVVNGILNRFRKFKAEFKLFDVDVDTAIERNRSRARTVGAHVIKQQYDKWQHLNNIFNFETREPQVVERLAMRENLRDAFVFDLDGTLSENVTGRSPFHWDRVGEDKVRGSVKACLSALKTCGYAVVICSGRDSCCEAMTRNWLVDNHITFDKLKMRPLGDQRPDWQVKEEMWRDLAEQYNLVAFFDDRQQVVDHGRCLGLHMFQVAQGDF